MWEIKSKSNLVKAVVDKLEYNGRWMEDCSVSVTIESPVPVDFAIGDYLTYREERFEINYDPGKIKSAPRNAKGDAFAYKDIKFNSLADELTRCDFLDVVLADNQIHFTGLPKFRFYSGVKGFADRIKANLDRLYPGLWNVVVSEDYTDTKELNVAVDNIDVKSALAILVNDFKVYYTIKDRTIRIGAAGVPAEHLFKYGKGNGLYQLEQNAESDQKIVTRLRAYGSTRNLPHRYYNSISGADGEKLIPDNMAVQNLMLPEFPYTTQDPYIDSANKSAIGIREGSVFFDGSQEGLDEIYPSIEGMTAEQLKSAGITCNSTGALDEIVSAEQMTDDGVGEISEDGSQTTANPATFKVTIKDLGFNLWDCRIAGVTPAISFKTGMLGGREFEIVECTAVKDNTGKTTGYELELNRVYDNDIKLWFPYSAYNAAEGDKFALLYIEMPEVYIKAAAVRLKEAAQAWLAKNDYSRSVYAPKVDEIFMARQHDAAIASAGTIKSLHDTLKEGMVMIFEDEDLNIDASVVIDSLTIREEFDKVPTYDVVLKEEKTVGRLDKMQNQIDSLASGQGQGGSGGYTAAQIRNLIGAYGDQRFLSKIKDDRTPYKVSTDKAFEVGEYLAGASGGILGKDSNGDSFAEIARLYVRVKAFFETLTIVNSEVLAGKRYITPGGGIKCTKLEETETAYRCYFLSEQDGEKRDVKMIVGDQAIAQTFNARPGTTNKVTNHYYWRLVTAVSNDAYTDDSGNHYGYVELSKSDCDTGSDVPQPGDEICQFGYRNAGNDERKTAMVFSTVDTDAPSVKLFSGINNYSLDGKAVISFGRDPLNNKVFFRLGASGATQYLEYTQDGGLVVKGAISSQSTIGGKEIDAYIKSVASDSSNIVAEYSETGADGTWHSGYNEDTDNYMRISTDGGQTWDGPIRLTGPGYTNNLLKNSETPVANTDYLLATYPIGEVKPNIGDDVTITVWGRLGNDRTYFFPYIDNGHNHLDTLKKISDGVYSVTTKWEHASTDDPAYDKNLLIYQYPSTGTWASQIDRIKLEIGKNETPRWTPYARGEDGRYQQQQWAIGTETAVTGQWQDTPPTPLAGEYVWMRTRTVDPSGVNTTEWSVPVRFTGEKGSDGSDAYLLDIENENITVPAASDGTVATSAYPATSVRVYKGASADSGWTFAASPASLATVTSTASGATVKVVGLSTGPTTVITITATKIISALKTLRLQGTLRVTKAAAGPAAVVYELAPSTNIITKDFDGKLSDTAVTCRVLKTTGTQTPVETTEKVLKYQRGGVDASPVTMTPGASVPVTAKTTDVVFLLYNTASDAAGAWIDRERVPVVSDASGMELSGENILLNSMFEGTDKWITNLDTKIDAGRKHEYYNSVKIVSRDKEENVWAGITQTYRQKGKTEILNPHMKVTPGDRFVLSVYSYCEDLSGIDNGAHAEFIYEDETQTVVGSNYVSLVPTAPDVWERKVLRAAVPDGAVSVRLFMYVVRNGTIWISQPQLERGNVLTEWKVSPFETDYLRAAMKEASTIDGGLILASLLRLGFTKEGIYRVMSGLSGIANNPDDISYWGGGEMIDAAKSPNNPDAAALLFRMDGTGYFARNMIRILEDCIMIGDNVRLDQNGLSLVVGEGEQARSRLVITNDSVGTDITLDSSQQVLTVKSADLAPAVNVQRRDTINAATGQKAPDIYYWASSKSTRILLGTPTNDGNLTANISLNFDLVFLTGRTGKIDSYIRYEVGYLDGATEKPLRSGSWSVTTTTGGPLTKSASLYMAVKKGKQLYAKFSVTKENYTGVAHPAAYAQVSAGGTVKFSSEQRTLLGNDGILSVWPNSAFLFANGMFKARAGNYGIAVTTTGFQKMTDGANWTPATL